MTTNDARPQIGMRVRLVNPVKPTPLPIGSEGTIIAISEIDDDDFIVEVDDGGVWGWTTFLRWKPLL